ncbi:hypothetical protein TWF730_003393 [Orbilia blumenaviensis]|uniref:Uncharacterized protein n=1 Tax=Orbilia blumenaviensis TaxID=1796055 RepID=A0AAV9U8P8_9PEZI
MSTIDYGTLGHVEYQTQKGEWSFTRRSESPRDVIALGGPALLVPPSIEGDASGIAKGGRQKLALQFTGSHTDFVPAVNQIIDMYEESRDVQYLSQWAVSKTSPLVAIASSTEAQPLAGTSHASRRVLVYATGTTGNRIAVAAVQRQRFAKEDLLIRRPSIKPQLQSIFECSGPIEQIQPIHEVEARRIRPYIIIRTQKLIYIVQITSESGLSGGDPLFGAICLGTIEAQAIGCSDLLHVAVNPWRGEQIAFIDTEGKWRVWDLSLRKTQKSKYVPVPPKLVASGELFGPEDPPLAWANLTWGAIENELLIATRKEIFKIDFAAGSQTDIFESIVKRNSADVEIINVVRPHIKPGFLLLLTNYHLQLLELNSEIKPVLNWKHCRHPEDRSLYCSAWNIDDAECVFIYSRYNPNISVLWGLGTGNPLDFSLLTVNWSDCQIMGLIILEGSTEETAGGEANRRSDVFTLATIGSNHGVWRQDYTLNPSIDARIFRNNRRGNRFALSDQIIDSSDESDGQSRRRGSRDDSTDLGSTFERLSLGTARRGRNTSNVSIINLGRVYEMAFDDERPLYRAGGQEDGRAFVQEYLKKLQLSLNPGEDADTFSPGLFNFLRPKKELEGLFDDLDMLFTGVNDLVKAAGPSTGVLDLKFAQNFDGIYGALEELLEKDGSSEAENTRITTEMLYESLSKIWLEALPADSPPKLRLRRERLARMVAIDIGLSSLGAYPRLVAPGHTEGQSLSDGGISFGLQPPNLVVMDEDVEITEPGRISGFSSRGTSRSRTFSSYSRMFLENFTPVVHTHVGDADMDGLLNDWDVDQPPENYEWRPVFRIQQQIAEDSQRSLSRSRSRSRKGSRRQSQRASPAANSDRMQGVQEDFPMTQPTTRTETAVLVPMPSSQVTSSQRFPASQVQRGKYGDSRKPKKRRTEGF